MYSVFGDDFKHKVRKKRVFYISIDDSVNTFDCTHVPLHYLWPSLSSDESASNQGLDLDDLLQLKFG